MGACVRFAPEEHTPVWRPALWDAVRNASPALRFIRAPAQVSEPLGGVRRVESTRVHEGITQLQGRRAPEVADVREVIRGKGEHVANRGQAGASQRVEGARGEGKGSERDAVRRC